MDSITVSMLIREGGENDGEGEGGGGLEEIRVRGEDEIEGHMR